MRLSYKEETQQVIVSWGSTDRSIANALAFLTAADAVTRFGARLETAMLQLLKGLT